MKNIVAYECENISIDDNHGENTLTKWEAEELYEYVNDKGLDKINFLYDTKQVKIVNYVGFIQLSSCTIEILPKTMKGGEKDPAASRLQLLNMLSRTGYIKISYSELTNTNIVNLNLFEIFGYLFAEKLKDEIIKGKTWDYIMVEESLPIIKGKTLINEYMKDRIKGNPLVCCQYHEFSSNNLLNQIFKRAGTILVKYVKNYKTLSLLRFCLINLSEVEDRHIGAQDLDKIFFNRMNKRFYESFLVAKLIINSSSFDTSLGHDKGISILFKMNELFEKYIAYVTDTVLEEEVLVQDERYSLLIRESTEREIFTLKPDIVVRQNNKDRVIIDTKWKIIDSSYYRLGVKGDDLYQMYAYLTKYEDVHRVILLYPHSQRIEKDSGQCLESWYLEGNPQKQIQVYSVNYEDDTRCEEDIKNMLKTL